MWQNPSSNSTQNTVTFQSSGNSGDEVVLKDSEGNEIISFKTEKSYSAIAISNSKIETGKSYTLYVNGNSVGTIEASNVVSSNLSSSGNGMGQGGMRQNGMKQGGMQQDNMQQGDMMKQDRMRQESSMQDSTNQKGMKQNMKNK